MRERLEYFARTWVPVFALTGTLLLWLNNTWQLEVMRETLQQSKADHQLDQRPWVGMLTIRDEHVAAGDPISAVLIFTNSGKSVALKVKTGVVVLFDPMHRSIDEIKLAANASEADMSYSEITIFPNAQVQTPISSRFTLTREEYQKLQNGSSALYLMGTLTYLDVFGKSHSTSTCLMYDPRPKGNPFSHCAKYNDAD